MTRFFSFSLLIGFISSSLGQTPPVRPAAPAELAVDHVKLIKALD